MSQPQGPAGTPGPYQQLTYVGSDSGGGFLGSVSNTINQAVLNLQAPLLAPGAEHRPPQLTECTNYGSYQHPVLYDMVHRDMDLVSAHETGRAWTEAGNTLADRADRLTKMVADSESMWQGHAAEQARASFTGLAQWNGQTAQGFQLAGNRVAESAEAAEAAKYAMPEPVTYDPWKMLREAVLSPNPLDKLTVGPQILAQRDRAVEAHNQAVQVMSTMEGRLTEVDTTAPQFAAPPPVADPTTTTPPGVTGKPPIQWLPHVVPPPTPGDSRRPGTPGRLGSPGGAPGGAPGAGVTPTGIGGGRGGLGGSGMGSGGGAAAGVRPAGADSNHGSTQPGGALDPGGFVPMPFGSAGAGLGADHTRGGGGFTGPIGSSGKPIGTDGRAGSEQLPGGAHSGAAPIPGNEGHGAGRAGGGTTPGRGPAGDPGMGVAPGGAARGGEDKEHRRKVVLEQDPDNPIVGPLPPTVPPVIGA